MSMRFRSSIDPLDSTFPLFEAPRLRVVARGEGVPVAGRDTALTIEVANLAQEPVEVRGVNAGYMYTNPLVEAAFGKTAPRLPLRELAEATSPPFMLDVGESVTWSTDLHQLEESVAEQQLVLGPHSSLVNLERIEEEVVRGIRRGPLTVKVRNVMVGWSFRRLAIAITDDRDILYKTKVRWQSPGGTPPTTPPHAEPKLRSKFLSG